MNELVSTDRTQSVSTHDLFTIWPISPIWMLLKMEKATPRSISILANQILRPWLFPDPVIHGYIIINVANCKNMDARRCCTEKNITKSFETLMSASSNKNNFQPGTRDVSRATNVTTIRNDLKIAIRCSVLRKAFLQGAGFAIQFSCSMISFLVFCVTRSQLRGCTCK